MLTLLKVMQTASLAVWMSSLSGYVLNLVAYRQKNHLISEFLFRARHDYWGLIYFNFGRIIQLELVACKLSFV
jgi:hypothetical protein